MASAAVVMKAALKRMLRICEPKLRAPNGFAFMLKNSLVMILIVKMLVFLLTTLVLIATADESTSAVFSTMPGGNLPPPDEPMAFVGAPA
jgi:hypothetical protein